MNEQTITESYRALSQAHQALFEAHEATVSAEIAYEDERAAILITSNPKELGSNEEQRNAKLSELLTVPHRALREAQARERAARYRYEQTRICVSQTTALLRYLALQQPAPASDGLDVFNRVTADDDEEIAFA